MISAVWNLITQNILNNKIISTVKTVCAANNYLNYVQIVSYIFKPVNLSLLDKNLQPVSGHACKTEEGTNREIKIDYKPLDKP